MKLFQIHISVIFFQRRKPNYFGGIYNILEATLNFLSPNDGNGLDREAAQNAGKKTRQMKDGSWKIENYMIMTILYPTPFSSNMDSEKYK